MVDALRGSNLVVQQSVQALLAAGLVVIHTDGLVRYQPASEAIGELAGAVETLYAERPNAVRRMIVSPPPSSIASFANAFKLRSDQ
ncbi:hypothetical protein [Sphingomonas xinjiangensis]|uniref:Uncharacterized protein n=1 Tax=Sphingomonas xinjiangensis TaxID=643568 RepID=A0A840YL12_9SPHN|nr:hypothetical protein [Sphingomonas xinjiangensis]MBB5710016.1 hypothetical protein [Sphingomonas xinjiangensis]